MTLRGRAGKTWFAHPVERARHRGTVFIFRTPPKHTSDQPCQHHEKDNLGAFERTYWNWLFAVTFKSWKEDRRYKRGKQDHLRSWECRFYALFSFCGSTMIEDFNFFSISRKKTQVGLKKRGRLKKKEDSKHLTALDKGTLNWTGSFLVIWVIWNISSPAVLSLGKLFDWNWSFEVKSLL